MNISVRGLSVLVFALVAILASNKGDAANVYLAPTSSGDWSGASSWSGSAVPTSSDSVFIVNGGTATITQAGETCSRLTLGGSGTGTIKMNSGSLIVSNAVYEELIGNAAPGSFAQSGGTHSIAHVVLLGNVGGASGTYALSGGSLAVPTVDVGNSGPGIFTQSGGTCSISSELDEGVSPGSSGTYTLSGSGLLFASQEVIGDEANCSFTQSGGTNSVANGLVLGQNSGATGTYNLNGGLLIVGSGGFTVGDGSAALNINGGTLSGSLVMNGTGILVLSGTNGYSGGTTVNSGKLIVVNAKSLLTGSSLTVGSSASHYFGGPTVPFEAPGGLQEVPEPSSVALFLGFCAISIVTLLWLPRRCAVNA